MNIDIDALISAMDSDNTQNTNIEKSYDSQYKFLYPFTDGKIMLRILYNPKAGVPQRRISRHDTGEKTKVPCLSTYGMDCPVCKAIKDVESEKGSECGAFKKYGYKIRGICYAYVEEIDSAYNKGKSDEEIIKKGDTILFMYPKTVFEAISKIIRDAGARAKSILADNEGIPLVIERETKGNGFPSYTVSLYPFGLTKVFNEGSDAESQAKFDAHLEELPNLNDQFVPIPTTSDPKSDAIAEIIKSAKALANTIVSEYSNSAINPNQVVNDEEYDLPFYTADDAITSSPKTESAPVQNASGGIEIDCFGNYKDDQKCRLCTQEYDCMKKSGK